MKTHFLFQIAWPRDADVKANLLTMVTKCNNSYTYSFQEKTILCTKTSFFCFASYQIKYFKLNLIFVVVFEGNYCIVLLIQ